MRAYHIGKAAGLHFVYAGNLPGLVGDCENTLCPKCNKLLIQRQGFHVRQNQMTTPNCPSCDAVIPGIWTTP